MRHGRPALKSAQGFLLESSCLPLGLRSDLRFLVARSLPGYFAPSSCGFAPHVRKKAAAAAFFRTCGANPQLDGAKYPGSDRATKNLKSDLKPNGKHDDSSKKPCADFNAGRPCRTLKADGSCVFSHRCNQFVSDKGPLGYCFGPHARCTGCTYADDKKLKSPAK